MLTEARGKQQTTFETLEMVMLPSQSVCKTRANDTQRERLCVEYTDYYTCTYKYTLRSYVNFDIRAQVCNSRTLMIG